MAGPTTRRPVAVLGATGVAGRQALAALARHPWFEVAAVAGSADSAGKRLGDVLAERAGTERRAADLIAAPRTEAQRAAEARGLPAALLDLRLQDSATLDVRGVAAVFSALPSGPARALEARCAATTPVFSTASAYRMEPDTPLLLAGVNPDHAELLAAQQRARGWRGFVAPGPNCTVVGLAVSLAPLQRLFGVTSVTLTSMQAVSGAGARAADVAAAVAGNILPWIEHEEEKVESEAHKILGTPRDGAVQPADFAVSATCTRVPVEDGHTLSVSAALSEPAGPGDVAAALLAEDPWRGRSLPSRPARWIEVRREPDRPQPLLDRDAGNGLTTVVGRLRRDAVHGGVKYLVLSHNAVMGAAGGAVLLAEDLLDRGFY
jgi:aspartate-semialdehyde dehydrogenase